MSRVFTGGTGNTLDYVGSLGITSSPVTILKWVKVTTIAQGVITSYNNTSSARIRCGIDGSGHFWSEGIQQFGGTATNTATASTNTWYPVIEVYESTNDLRLHALSESVGAGGFVGTFVAESSPRFSVGTPSYNPATAAFTGKVAHIAIWSSQLNTTNINALIAGADPSTVSPGTLIEHWALTGASLTGANGRVLALTGTVSSDTGDNPPIGSSPATLSAPTPSGTLATQTTATIGATTDQASGTLYVVASATQAHITGITAAQVIAGQTSSGGAAPFSGNGAVSTATPSVGVTGLSGGTLYYYAVAQVTSGGNSNVVTGSFTTANSTRSASITLYSSSGSALASTNLRVWTRTGLSAAAADGGSTGLALTTNGSGVLSVTNLSIAAGSGWLTIRDDTDDNNCHNYPVTFS